MANAVMSDSISSIPEFQAWYNIIKETLAEMDLSKMLVYIIDTVDASALPYLAAQFDVLGYNGFRLAQTEAAQRAVLKQAISLHKYKGTEWAIEQALISIGFSDITIKSGIAGGYDHWAKFGLQISNTELALSSDSFAEIIQMVNNYKRAVCVLADVNMNLLFTDSLNLDNDTAWCQQAIMGYDVLQLSGNLKYDGSAEFNGLNNFSGDTDVASIT